MTFVGMLVKWSVTLTDRLGPEILTVLEIKGQVLHRVRLHVKLPGWLLNLNALLTKKLARGNMCLVSVPDLNCAKNMKIAKAFKLPSTHPTQEG